MSEPSARTGAMSFAATALAVTFGLLAAVGGATGDFERMLLAAAACVGVGLVAACARSLDPIVRPSGAEVALVALAVWSALAALPWPDGLARTLAPFTWSSREAALGTGGGVAPSLDVGATARAAIVLAALAFLAAAARVVVERGALQALLRGLAVVALAHAAAGLLRGRYAEDDLLLFGLPADNALNAYGTFQNRTQFAAFLGVLLMGPVGLLFRPRAAIDRPLAVVSALVIAGAIAGSGSRAGMLGIGLAGLLVVLAAPRRARGWLLVAGFVVVAGVGVARALGVDALVRLLPLRSDEGNRLETWRGTVDLIGEQPVVGVGLDAFRYAYAGEGRGPIDHWVGIAENDGLQGLAEVGIVGAALAVIALLCVGRAIRDDARASRPGQVPIAAALSGLAALLPLVMTSSPLHQPGVAAAAVLGFAAARGLVRGDDAGAGREYGSRPSEAASCAS